MDTQMDYIISHANAVSKNWKILLQHSSTSHMPLLTATSILLNGHTCTISTLLLLLHPFNAFFQDNLVSQQQKLGKTFWILMKQ